MAEVTVPIPLGTPVYKNVLGEELNDKGSSTLIDGYVDELGAINARPGLASFGGLGSSFSTVVGLYWWGNKGYAVGATSSSVYKINLTSSLLQTTDLTGATVVVGSNRPTFATDGYYLYMAGGNGVQYTDGTSAFASMTLGDPGPTSATHVVYLDGYVLANLQGSRRIFFSTPGNLGALPTWTSGDYFAAEVNPDFVNALLVKDQQLYIFGPSSLEIWENDGETPFSRIPGGAVESGTLAPYSPIATDEAIYWLDQDRHIVQWDSRAVKRISTPYDRVLKGMASVSDCRSDKIDIAGKTFLIFHFPAGNLTLCYNISEDSWSEWGAYSSRTMSYDRWRGNCYAYCPDWNLHLVGSARNQDVYQMSATHYTDVGEPIRVLKRTGHLSFGTSKTKRSRELRLRAARGKTSSTTTPSLMVRWRDDNAKWSQEKTLSLGKHGQTDLTLRLFRTGIFRTRQYEISATDAVPIMFTEAEEDIEVLR